MSKLMINENPAVRDRIESYPKKVQVKLNKLRSLILESAAEIDNIGALEETLKWNEPSYLVKKGSTIRIDWKPKKNPDQYAIYFKCTSKLVVTFKELYGDTFNYEKTRAIVFDMKDKVPKKQLKECIKMALQYHTLKDKPLLGQG